MQHAKQLPLDMTPQHLPHGSTPFGNDLPTQQRTYEVDMIEQVNQQLHVHQLGLQSNSGFIPVPVSLTPWQLTPEQFTKAQQLAALLGQLQVQAADNLGWLIEQLGGLRQSQTVPGQIWRTLNSLIQAHACKKLDKTAGRSRNLMLNRHDFLLDQQQQWRWVESNPIAAGMGPLNSRYLALLQQHQSAFYAPHGAITTQSKLLAQAAFTSALQQQPAHTRTRTRTRTPLMLTVVETEEDNIFDQALLLNEVQRLGVRVERVTIKQLLQSEFNRFNQFLWQTQQVDLIYWRTGYNPAAELNDDFWQFRARLEQAEVVQCPTLAGQLAGSKWFQHRLTAMLFETPSTIMKQFNVAEDAINQLVKVIVPSFAISELKTELANQLIAQGYWYKTQQEGGGNVTRAQGALQKLTNPDIADVLMAPIDPVVRQTPFISLRKGTACVASEQISELGIFSLGDQASYGGYLCRTKSALSNDGGVHRGGAVLDTIVFT